MAKILVVLDDDDMELELILTFIKARQIKYIKSELPDDYFETSEIVIEDLKKMQKENVYVKEAFALQQAITILEQIQKAVNNGK